LTSDEAIRKRSGKSLLLLVVCTPGLIFIFLKVAGLSVAQVE
jgi:hypothetical protein